MEPVRIAWAAGLLDGEGSIAARRTSGSGLGLMLRLVMTEREGVEQFREVVGHGTLRSQRGIAPRIDSYVWTLCAAQPVGEVLRALLPHLVVKRRDAELALAFLATDDLAERTKIAAQLRARKSKPGNRGAKR